MPATIVAPVAGRVCWERAASPFGVRLRQRRRHRGISQLALATEVGSTARHLSFLETGRSRPSRQMVLRLCAALGVGLRESNQLLHAAGLPASYPHMAIDSPNLAPYQTAIGRMLQASISSDGRRRHFNVVLANRACANPHDAAAERFFRDRHRQASPA